MARGELVFVVGPGGGLVVEGAGFEASVQDADEPVGDLAQGRVVPGAAGALGAVQGPGAGRGAEGGEGLSHERVGEPVVADEPGGDDLLLPRGAGDRGGGGVVLAGLCRWRSGRGRRRIRRGPGRRGWVPGRAGTGRSQRPGGGQNPPPPALAGS